jgi:cation diffusion facilitator CzcD-associated flavoprotein CzcO
MAKHEQDPSSRKLKVLTIGAGLSSIQMAYMIQKYCQNVELVVYEKNAEIGGTWYENQYPGKLQLHVDI